MEMLGFSTIISGVELHFEISIMVNLESGVGGRGRGRGGGGKKKGFLVAEERFRQMMNLTIGVL